MPIFYNVRKRITPLAKGKKERYYLIAKSWDKVEYEDLIGHMVRNTSLTKEEARTALSYLLEAIPELLKLGYTIDLGQLGYLMVTIQSEGSDTPQEASVHKIRNMRIRFIPNRKLQQIIRKLPVEHFPNRGETIYQSGYNHAMKKAQRETRREQQIETVRNCISEGLSVETIARITGLSEQAINEIINNLSQL